MAHEIDNPEEAIYSNNPAWHRLGTVFNPGQTEGMLTGDIQRLCPTLCAPRKLLPIGGFRNPETDLRDPFLMFGANDILGGGDWRMIARTDGQNSKVHGIAKKGYRVWQVSEAFAFLDSLVRDGLLQYESAFALNGGDHVVLVCRLPGSFTLGRRDTTVQYVMVKIAFTGQDSVIIIPTFVRVVCANTVAYAERQASRSKVTDTEGKVVPVTFKMRHTRGLDDRLVQAREHLKLFDASLQVEAENAEKLASKPLSASEASAFLRLMFPETDDAGDPLAGKVATERERKVSVVRRSLVVERNTFGAMGEYSLQRTAWEMFNAVTRAVDHDGLLRTRGDSRKRDENTFLSSATGKGADLKVQARSTLLQLAGA